MKKILISSILLLSHISFADYTVNLTAGGKIRFAGIAGTSASLYSQKMDIRQLQKTLPLSMDERQNLMPADLEKMSQEEIDQVYLRLSSGTMPEGDYKTSVLIKGELETKLIKFARNNSFILKALNSGTSAICSAVNAGSDSLKCLAEFIWNGKKFYPLNADGEIEQRNAVDKAPAYSLTQFLDFHFTAGLKYDQQNFFGSNKYMMFPAHVFCGESMVDQTRESIVADYMFGNDFTQRGFNPKVDGLAGRNGLKIRDEIRMVRPGFYIGRAYGNKVFLLTFSMYNPDLLNQKIVTTEDACFTAKTPRQ